MFTIVILVQLTLPSLKQGPKCGKKKPTQNKAKAKQTEVTSIVSLGND